MNETTPLESNLTSMTTEKHTTTTAGAKAGTAQVEPRKLDCGHSPSPHSDFTTGYGKDAQSKTFCYACAAEIDKKAMRETGRATLYLTGNAGEYEVTNWPGSLRFQPHHARIGRHNIARKRYDVWFTFDGQPWHGVTYGDNTQICHCRKIKV